MSTAVDELNQATTPSAAEAPGPIAVQRSGLLLFFERFLDESSIRWMLGLGMLTLLACSLKFVTDHWDSYSPFWKYLVFIAYTAVMYGLAEISLKRLALRRTGVALLALTLALSPLTFLALRWVAPAASPVHDVGLAALLLISLAFTAFASRRILRHLLRQVPTTYWLSYLVLSSAGALVPAIPADFATLTGVGLWLAFTTGVVKVNRHVFWLSEEQCWPRIFAFYPSALLAAQFLTVFTLNLTDAIALPWLGLGLVLVAVPVLLTADAFAAVFQRRTGQIVFPWPAEIIVPLVVGLACCLAGLCLALTDLPRPVAFVPTAVLAAICLGVVAHRAGYQVFAWGMLFCLLGAYQFSPVYFQEMARHIRDQSAVAVHEARLPYAFYGITYAPFILALAVMGRWLKSATFREPCRQLAVLLGVVMLAASWTHPKAVFIAGFTLTVLWTLLRFAFRDARLTWGIGIAWLSAALGFQTFVQDVCLMPVAAEFGWWTMTLAAASLWLVDRVTARPPSSTSAGDTLPYGSLEILSVAGDVVLAYGWFIHFGMVLETAGTTLAAALIALLAVHQRQRVYPLLGELLLLLTGWVALRYGWVVGIAWEALMLATAVVLATGWSLAMALESCRTSRWVLGFRRPVLHVTTTGLAVLQTLAIPALFVATLAEFSLVLLATASLVTIWSLLAAGRILPTSWVHIGCFSLLAVVSRIWLRLGDGPVMTEWLPVLWSITALLSGAAARRWQVRTTDEASRVVAANIQFFVTVTQALLALGTLMHLTTPARIAGGLSILGLAVRARQHTDSAGRHFVVESTGLQCAAVCLMFVTPAEALWQISTKTWLDLQLPGTLLMAIWLWVLQTPFVQRFATERKVLTIQIECWRILSLISLVTMPLWQISPLTVLELVALIGTVGLLVADQFRQAVIRQNESCAWLGLLLGALGVAYLVWFDSINPYHVVTQGSGLAAGIVLSVIAGLCRRRPSATILARPLEQVGYWLPAGVAGVAVMGSLQAAPATWLGTNSLIVLMAAISYFVRWIERGGPQHLTFATAIFNVSQMLLWRELRWSDPQLYLMPLGLSLIGLAEGLPRELRPEAKAVLRYAGALVILTSPLFHILDGWLPLLTLMAASLLVSLLAIGLKSRPLLYSGTAFLAADLVALVVRGGLEHADVLWVAGIGLGTAVVGLAAYCENHRELILQRMRFLAATLNAWD